MTWDPDSPSTIETRPSPTCPTCGTNTDIERLRTPIADRQFWCGSCDSVFAGTTGEWERMRTRRDRHIAGFYQFKGWPDTSTPTTEDATHA